MGSIIERIYENIRSGNRLEKDIYEFRHAKKILDIGCGRGNFLKLIGDRGVGIDGSKDNVDFCKNAGLKVYEVALPNKLPFNDADFDGIYCSHLIEHFPPDNAILIMKEINRVLRPGGILFIRSPLYSPAFFDDPTHVRPYHLHSVLHLLGGWEKPGTRQIIIGNEHPSYKLLSYYEEIIPLYTSSVAPTIAPSKFPFRLTLRGMSYLLTKLYIGRKGAYGAVLRKNEYGN